MTDAFHRINGDWPVRVYPGPIEINLESQASPFYPVIRTLYAIGYASSDFAKGGRLYKKTLEELRSFAVSKPAAVIAVPIHV